MGAELVVSMARNNPNGLGADPFNASATLENAGAFLQGSGLHENEDNWEDVPSDDTTQSIAYAIRDIMTSQ